MQGVLVIGGEEVLYRSTKTIGSAEPISQGIALVKLMTGVFSCHVICDTTDKSHAEMWCRLNGLKEVMVYTRLDVDGPLASDEFQCRQISRLQAQGPLFAVITGWDSVADFCLENGLNALTFKRPASLGTVPKRQPFNERVEEIRSDTLRRIGSEHEEGEPAAPV